MLITVRKGMLVWNVIHDTGKREIKEHIQRAHSYEVCFLLGLRLTTLFFLCFFNVKTKQRNEVKRKTIWVFMRPVLNNIKKKRKIHVLSALESILNRWFVFFFVFRFSFAFSWEQWAVSDGIIIHVVYSIIMVDHYPLHLLSQRMKTKSHRLHTVILRYNVDREVNRQDDDFNENLIVWENKLFTFSNLMFVFLLRSLSSECSICNI